MVGWNHQSFSYKKFRNGSTLYRACYFSSVLGLNLFWGSENESWHSRVSSWLNLLWCACIHDMTSSCVIPQFHDVCIIVYYNVNDNRLVCSHFVDVELENNNYSSLLIHGCSQKRPLFCSLQFPLTIDEIYFLPKILMSGNATNVYNPCGFCY